MEPSGGDTSMVGNEVAATNGVDGVMLVHLERKASFEMLLDVRVNIGLRLQWYALLLSWYTLCELTDEWL